MPYHVFSLEKLSIPQIEAALNAAEESGFSYLDIVQGIAAASDHNATTHNVVRVWPMIIMYRDFGGLHQIDATSVGYGKPQAEDDIPF